MIVQSLELTVLKLNFTKHKNVTFALAVFFFPHYGNYNDSSEWLAN